MLRFESALLTASHIGALASIEQRNEIVREAASASRLRTLVTNWRSRPQALAVVAELALEMVAHHGILSPVDVEKLMALTEQSWMLNPDLPLEHLNEPAKARFEEMVAEVGTTLRTTTS